MSDSYCFIQPHYAVLDLQYKMVDSLAVIALRFVDSCFQKITLPEESTKKIMSFLLLISLFTNWTAFWEPLGIAIIAALNSASRWKQHRGLQGGQSPLPCTHVSGACKKQPCFKENWMDFPKMLAFNSEFALAFVIQPFKVKFVFLNANFSKYSWAEQQPWFKYQQRGQRLNFFIREYYGCVWRLVKASI